MGIYLKRNYFVVSVYLYQIGNSMISLFHSLPGTRKPFLYMNHGIDLNFTPPQDLDQLSHLLSSLAQGNSSLSFYPSFSFFSLGLSLTDLLLFISCRLPFYILYFYISTFLHKKILKQA